MGPAKNWEVRNKGSLFRDVEWFNTNPSVHFKLPNKKRWMNVILIGPIYHGLFILVFVFVKKKNHPNHLNIPNYPNYPKYRNPLGLFFTISNWAILSRFKNFAIYIKSYLILSCCLPLNIFCILLKFGSICIPFLWHFLCFMQ